MTCQTSIIRALMAGNSIVRPSWLPSLRRRARRARAPPLRAALRAAGGADTPAEGVVEARARRRAHECVGQREVANELRKQRLAQIHADRLVELAGAEPLARVGRRELDLEIRADLGHERRLFEQHVL